MSKTCIHKLNINRNFVCKPTYRPHLAFENITDKTPYFGCYNKEATQSHNNIFDHDIIAIKEVVTFGKDSSNSDVYLG